MMKGKPLEHFERVINVGEIRGVAVAIGKNTRVSVYNFGVVLSPELHQIFDQLRENIESLPELSSKATALKTVDLLEHESNVELESDSGRVENLFDTLKEVAPSVWLQAIGSLSHSYEDLNRTVLRTAKKAKQTLEEKNKGTL